MNIISNEDTITAIATPGGIGAVSIIRVSGDRSFDVIDKIFVGKEKPSKCSSHTIHYGKIVDNSEFIDDVLVSIFKEPNSYTGENSIEISTHGSPLIQKKILELLFKYDVRLAEPGEFTKRAYLNGRMDLTQAEAVADVINARTEASLKGARNQLDGMLSSKIDQLRTELINTSSLIELELDFAEEDIEFLSKQEVYEKILAVIKELDSLLSTYSFGRIIREGVNVAIVGIPNVGKSSLLNYLLKESRAIVSEIPGTTRDIIREDISIEGILFRLFDTAGIRSTEDAIEKEGVIRSQQAIKDADLVLLIDDVERGFSQELHEKLLELTTNGRIIKVLNKIDLKRNSGFIADAFISSKTGEGIDELLKILKLKAIGNSSYTEKTAIVSNVRHYNALKSARINLLEATESIKTKLSGEFIAVNLRNAINNLSEIIGVVTTEDILNNIFSKFCIGK